MRIEAVTVSDKASAGINEDKSGPAIERVLMEGLPEAAIDRCLVPDGLDPLLKALERHAAEGADWILTTGGTGPSPRDWTPEATAVFCNRELPGIAEYLRAESLKETPNAVFSRLIAGMSGTVFVVNLPGSERAATFCTKLLAPLLEHGRRMSPGERH